MNREYFNKITLDFKNITWKGNYLQNVGLTRIFKEGGCGRWYQKGGYSYQQLSEEERLKVLLNTTEVNELDYSAMHPNILYTWENQQAPADVYGRVINYLKNNGYPTINKFPVKLVILTSINASSFNNLKSAILDDGYHERKANEHRLNEDRQTKKVLHDELKKISLDEWSLAKAIVDSFMRIHPSLAKYVYSRSANKLMLCESEIMTSVLFELMNQKIPSVPIHDSLLFPKQYTNKVRRVMHKAYRDKTGFRIRVK